MMLNVVEFINKIGVASVEFSNSTMPNGCNFRSVDIVEPRLLFLSIPSKDVLVFPRLFCTNKKELYPIFEF